MQPPALTVSKLGVTPGNRVPPIARLSRKVQRRMVVFPEVSTAPLCPKASDSEVSPDPLWIVLDGSPPAAPRASLPANVQSEINRVAPEPSSLSQSAFQTAPAKAAPPAPPPRA